MGLGLVRTRSGYDSSEPHTQSRCKPILRSMMEWTRDLVLLLFYTLPGTPKTLRVYGLMFVRMLLYGIEGLILYSLTLTIVVGEKVKDPGVLVELTRLLLCHNTGRAESHRDRRSATTWLNFLSDVNETYPELSEVLDGLVQPAENLSETVFPNIPTISSTWSTTLNSTLDSILYSTWPTTLNSTLDSILSSTWPTTLNSTLDSILSSTWPATLNNTMNFTLSSTMPTAMRALTTPTATSDPRTAMKGYRLGWCLEVFNLETNISTLTCSSSLMAPICILVVVILFSTTIGFLCAVRQRAGRPTGERV